MTTLSTITSGVGQTSIGGLMRTQTRIDADRVGDGRIEAGAAHRVEDEPSAVGELDGSYRGNRDSSPGLMELRIDIGGAVSAPRVSGDIFGAAGGTTNYIGSFLMSSPSMTARASGVRIEGEITSTWSTSPEHLEVDVARSATGAPGPAVVRWSSAQAPDGASWTCAFVSTHFRTVAIELDSVAGQVPFASYDLGSLPLPPGELRRVLTVSGAFAEAGIDLRPAGTTNAVASSDAGSNARWSARELHAAMVNNFSRFADAPQWNVWLLVATAFDDPDPVRGIMFDFATGDGFQRQGCAVFNDQVAGTDASTQRAALRTYVHELGHCFNLLHSWEKHVGNPPAPLGPNNGRGDRSWMNYAQNYQPPPPAPGGTAAYWNDFRFSFTAAELVHLRHGFREDVIMGGNPFGTGAAELDPVVFNAPIDDHSGFTLELRTRAVYAYGEPVVVEIKLGTTDTRGAEAVPTLHPQHGLVSIAIRRPSGRVVPYRPMLRRCAEDAPPRGLVPGRAAYDSAYIGAGATGTYFDAPGEYQLRARYIAPDGSHVVSPPIRLRIRPPLTEEDERVGELLSGPEQGQLLQVLGSESPALQTGNDAFGEVIAEHGRHPLALYARLARGFPGRRPFKELTAEKEIRVHPARPDESAALLGEVVQTTKAAGVAGPGLDNVSLNQTMRALAEAEARRGHTGRAHEVLDDIVPTLRGRGVGEPVLQGLTRGVEDARAALPTS
ncbi:hypothetical protein [Actinomycetospora chibensis]|uniref:hypothetical protein n=1 Tax=Actinomycetospora chibensis TaxID=663606 RepID=UPI00236526C4|nr:hypothetical protein [Actinomycetospora chibensis]